MTIRAIAAVLLLAAPAVVPLPSHTEAGDVYVPGPAVYLAGPGVSGASWSPDGRYIFAVAAPDAPPPPPASASFAPPSTPAGRLLLINRRTRRATVQWSPPWPQSAVERAEWLPGSDTLLVIVRSRKFPENPARFNTDLRLVRLDARKGTVSEPMDVDQLWAVFETSPRLPATVMIQGGEGPHAFRIMTSDGMGPEIPMPAGDYGGKSQWSLDGETLYFAEYRQETDAGGKSANKRAGWRGLNVRTGMWSDLTAKPAFAPPKNMQDAPFSLESPHERLARGATKAPIRPLWLVNGDENESVRFLLSADAVNALPAPTNDAVLYESGGLLLLRPLVRTPRAQYMQKHAAEVRSKAEENGKQIGLALSMYSNDYDGALPTPSSNIKDAADPYLRNADAWNGADGNDFTYTFPGGPLGNAAQRKMQVVGYFPAPGGRVTVYGDGHTEWQPNP